MNLKTKFSRHDAKIQKKGRRHLHRSLQKAFPGVFFRGLEQASVLTMDTAEPSAYKGGVSRKLRIECPGAIYHAFV
jgi:hypothetical protein